MNLRFDYPSDNPFNLKYKNDGKGKHGSAEAGINTSFSFVGGALHGSLDLTAYEETESAAQHQLLDAIAELIQELQKFHAGVERLPPETEEQRDARLRARRGLLY